MIDLSPLDRHAKIALSFSGGKDSLACVHLLREHLDKITIYHLDTGDLLPEMAESVDRVRSFAPNFIALRGDVRSWIARNGLPTDLLPYSAHSLGQALGQGQRLVSRYGCCFHNLMLPVWERIRDDGNTLCIRGTKTVDMPQMPVVTGDILEGVEFWYPLQDWSHADVFRYLGGVGAQVPRIYDYMNNSPECARCTAWWGEDRAGYLRKFHPALFEEYRAGLHVVAAEIRRSLIDLDHELEGCADV
jgi:phosphoadenosine phosphosulfate reductase